MGTFPGGGAGNRRSGYWSRGRENCKKETAFIGACVCVLNFGCGAPRRHYAMGEIGAFPKFRPHLRNPYGGVWRAMTGDIFHNNEHKDKRDAPIWRGAIYPVATSLQPKILARGPGHVWLVARQKVMSQLQSPASCLMFVRTANSIITVIIIITFAFPLSP